MREQFSEFFVSSECVWLVDIKPPAILRMGENLQKKKKWACHLTRANILYPSSRTRNLFLGISALCQEIAHQFSAFESPHMVHNKLKILRCLLWQLILIPINKLCNHIRRYRLQPIYDTFTAKTELAFLSIYIQLYRSYILSISDCSHFFIYCFNRWGF